MLKPDLKKKLQDLFADSMAQAEMMRSDPELMELFDGPSWTERRKAAQPKPLSPRGELTARPIIPLPIGQNVE